MNRMSLILAALVSTVFTSASASPKDEVARLLLKSKPANVVFSDGSSQWKSEGTAVTKLEDSKVVIVQSKSLSLDTDGASKEIRACDLTAQAGTALSESIDKPTDANSIPYFVLPWCGDAKDIKKCRAKPPYIQLGLQKGDLAAVIVNDKIAFAIAADIGPEKKFGEGSIELHRQLGHETVGKNSKNPKCAANISLASEVTIVIFQKSNSKWLPKEDIKIKANKLWEELLIKEGVKP